MSAKDASLAADYNPLKRPAGRSGTLDVGNRGEVLTDVLQESPEGDFVATLHQQVLTLGGASDWSLEGLIAWMDRQIDHQDIPVGESAEFLRKVIRGLMAKFSISDVGVLALDRFRLRDEVERRIREHRDTERKIAFQGFLLPDAPLVVGEERSINFKSMNYEPGWLYEGGFQFKKHYFGPKPGELEEKRSDGSLREEFRCAQFLDGLEGVKFWVRNLARKATSFRLQTSQDWFYPDFLCQMDDGRVFVVEYKGAHLLAGSGDKFAVGKVWESRSNGRCRFFMPTDGDFEEIRRAVQQG